MIGAMYTTNLVLLIIFGLGSVVSYLTEFKGGAYSVGQLFGIFIWLAPLFCARRALSVDGEFSDITTARQANVAILVLLILLVVVMSLPAERKLAPLIFIVFLAIPYVLNIFALAKKYAQLNEVPPINATAFDVVSPLQEKSADTEISSGDEHGFNVEQNRASYIVRHWRGDLSLAISYWVNGLLIAGAGGVLLMLLIGKIDSIGSYSLRISAVVFFIATFFSLIVWSWSAVGIWRSAGKHEDNGGSDAWSLIARLLVVVSVIGTGFRIVNVTIPQSREFFDIAVGKDPLGKVNVKASVDGKLIYLSGALGEGSAQVVEEVLRANPNATTLVLNSNGGRLREARILAEEIHRKKLNTYVESLCASACTYLFLAGVDRAATPDAKIGFHRPSFAGVNDTGENFIVGDMLDVYRSAGLPESFIDRVAHTPAASMWYPTHEEMTKAGVVNRISLDGEIRMADFVYASKDAMALEFQGDKLFRAYEKRFPGTIKEAVDLAWIEKEKGGNDVKIMGTARSVLAKKITLLMKTANNEILDRYSVLMLDELLSAKKLSNEACANFLSGRLDVSKAFSKNLMERDQAWTMNALEAKPRAEAALPPANLLKSSFAMATRSLSNEHLQVISAPDRYYDQPELQCDAFIELYQSIHSLPLETRLLTLRGMFQE